MSGGFRRLDEDVLHSGYIFDLVRARFEAPDGEVFSRDIVRHPGAVSVVPVDADGRIVMVWQYRPALDAFLLEIPAGKRDVADEPPAETAQDELQWIYLGRALVEVPRDVQGIEESHMEIERLTFAEARARILDGRLTDMKSIIGILLAASMVDGR